MLTVATVVWSPSSAQAHDQLVGSDPAGGSTATGFPAVVNLTFTDQPLDIGATVAVVDTTDKNYTSDLSFDGNVVTARLNEGATDANYQVRWRVVSSDGHVISGAFDFEVGDASSAPEFPKRAGVDTASTLPEDSSGADDDTTRTALVAVAGALGALGLWAAFARLRSRTPSRQEK